MENIYLITSSSYRLLEEEVKKIVKDNPYVSFDLNYQTMEDALDEANYYSLFDDKKYIVVKNASIFCAKKRKSKTDDEKNDDEVEEIVKPNEELLIKYLESPNPNTILIFSVNGNASTAKKITKIINDKYEYITVSVPKSRDIHDDLKKHFKKNGFEVDDNIIYYIIDSSLKNYDIALNEAEKVMLYYKKGCKVLFEDVKNIVSSNIEDNNFAFIDAVLERDVAKAFKIYDDLMIQKVMPNMLIIMLANEIRNILLSGMLKNSKNISEIMKILKIQHEFRVKKFINYSYNYSKSQLEEYLSFIGDVDYKIKTNKLKPKNALQLVILEICK